MIRKLLTITLLFNFCFFANPTETKSAPASKVTVKEYIVKHSLEMGIDPALGLSIAKMESGFVHEKRSSYGAVGVFQLMPSTAKRIGYNPYSLSGNIQGGLAYYKMMYKKFGSMELALAAYNAGPGNVSKYKGVPPFAETKKFVRVIMSDYHQQKSNPDPVITKYQRQKAQSAVQKTMIIDKNENILKVNTEIADTELPLLPLTEAI